MNSVPSAARPEAARAPEVHSGPRILAFSALFLMAALYVVGFVSHGVLRHIVQTAPVWLTVVLGFRSSRWSKWTALPCFACWLVLMTLIWLFLLGWVRVISGTFSPVEIGMTVVVGTSSILGIVTSLRMRSGKSAAAAVGLLVLVLAIQIVALKVSYLPAIAHD